MDATPVHTFEAQLELAQALFRRALTSAAGDDSSAPLAAEAAEVTTGPPVAEDATLVAALERARAHLDRRRAELPPLPA